MDQKISHATELGLDIRPMTGYTGAEIFGVDLTKPLDPAVVAEIRAALLQWKVVFFRDQFIDRDQHLALARAFGDPIPGHPTFPPSFPDYPEILLLDNQQGTANVKEKKGASGPRIESRWHTDVKFIEAPPMGSILRAVVVPPYGGDTQWSNLAMAYSYLSPEIKAFIDGLHAVNHNALPIDRGEMPGEIAKAFMSKPLRAVHPVVRVHPETGEKVLFVEPNFTDYIVELSRRESKHILAMLCEHLQRQEFTVRFRWEPGSIAFWDNRATAHIVPMDVPKGMHRCHERITIAGDIPVDPAGNKSYVLEPDI